MALVRIEHDHLLMYGGLNSVNLRDVWRSGDGGATWWQVASAEWPARHAMAHAVTTDGTIVMGAGVSATGHMNDVWRSFDHGTTWYLATGAAAWSPRRGAKMLAIANDGLLLLGGETPYNDEVWRSDDHGSTWELITDAPGWAPRTRLGAVVLSDGTVVVAGGAGSTGSHFNDVWSSANDGAAWTEVSSGAAWSGRDHVAMVALPDNSLVVYSGLISGTMQTGVYISLDRGATWANVAASFPGDRYFIQQATVALSDGRIVVAGGSNPGYRSDVWRSTLTWRGAACSGVKPGVCAATANTAVVRVTLPADQGDVSPANTATTTAAIVNYAPPVPTVTLSGGAVAVTVDADLYFDVSFTSPVSGLQASDFVVGLGHAVAKSVALQGSASSWVLAVVVDAASVPTDQCPAGYMLSSGDAESGAWCGRAAPSRATWAAAEAACGPYHLATVTSSGQQAFLAGLGARWPIFSHHW